MSAFVQGHADRILDLDRSIVVRKERLGRQYSHFWQSQIASLCPFSRNVRALSLNLSLLLTGRSTARSPHNSRPG